MATKPLSAAEMEKVKNYLMGNALKGGTGSGIPYSPEYIDKLKTTAAKVKPKAKATKGLLSAKALEPTGLLQSPDTEFTTDNVNPYMNPFTQDAMGPTVQETVAAAKPGVPALPSAVPTVAGDPNIAVSQTAPQPKMTKEVTTTTKPDGTKIEKARHTEEAPKAAKPTASNGDLIPADAMPKDDGKPKFKHNMPPVGVDAASIGPAEAPKEGMPIPDDNPYALPEKYRFDPTAPPVPIVAQYPAQMPAIPEGRLTNTEGLTPAENTATQGLTTNISALAPLPKEEEERFAALREQRLGQIYDNEAAAKDFITSYSPRTDMSALLSFIGSQLGKDYLKGYQKPAGLGDLVGMQDKLEENIAKAKTGLSDTDMQYLKARMGLQDSQKASEELRSLYKSLELEKLKRPSGAPTPASVRADKALDYTALKDYNHVEGEGRRIQAFSHMLRNGIEVRKILDRNGGIPALGTTDYNTLKAEIASQLLEANRFVALLGALSTDDLGIITEAGGYGDRELSLFLRTAGNAERLNDALDRAQRQLMIKAKDVDSAARSKYQDFPKTLEQHNMEMGKYQDAEDTYKYIMLPKNVRDAIDKRAQEKRKAAQESGGK